MQNGHKDEILISEICSVRVSFVRLKTLSSFSPDKCKKNASVENNFFFYIALSHSLLVILSCIIQGNGRIVTCLITNYAFEFGGSGSGGGRGGGRGCGGSTITTFSNNNDNSCSMSGNMSYDLSEISLLKHISAGSQKKSGNFTQNLNQDPSSLPTHTEALPSLRK